MEENMRKTKKCSKKIFLAIMLAGAASFLSLLSSVSAEIIFDDSFDSASIDTNKWAYSINGPDWSIGPVNSPARSGNSSAKFYIRRVDSTSYRAELTPKSLSTFSLNNDYWFGFSLYLPEDWINDIEGETVFQVHSNPDLNLGELWRSPPLQLQFDEDTNKWSWINIWDPKEVTIGNDPRPEGGSGSLWLGDLPKGRWIDWVIHYKPHYLSGGIVEIWKDGQQIVNKSGPNAYNDRNGLFVKAGIYKSKWKDMQTNVNARVLYIDEFRVGNKNSSYEEVMPGPKTYYAAPPTHNPAPIASGSCALENPCALDYAINTKAYPGDTILLKDGTYTGADYMINVKKSGIKGKPIIIKAENDGKVIVDGQMSRRPCSVAGTDANRWHDINIEGIVCKNSNNGVVQVSYADRIQLRRVSGYNAYVPGNYHVFTIWHTTDVLLEDCAASGGGRDMFDVSDTDYTTIRRCWAKEVNYVTPGGVGDIVQVYGSNNAIIENVVGINETGITADGIVTWNKYYNTLYHGDHNTYLGNILYNLPNVWHYMDSSAHFQLHDNKYINNVSIGASYGLLVDGDDSAVVRNNTIIDTVNTAMAITTRIINPGDADYPKESPFYVNALIRDNNIAKITGPAGSNGISKSSEPGVSADHDYNNVYNYTYPFSGTPQGVHETAINPDYRTDIYGKGAYLIKPSNLKGLGENGADIGAEALYQYENGVLTSKPLWPWLMEDRICAETGYSVTYENGYPGCVKGGGTWKTLDGVYPEDNSADINNDKSINIQDIQACVNVILGVETNPDIVSRAKTVSEPLDACDVLDLQMIVNEILAGT